MKKNYNKVIFVIFTVCYCTYVFFDYDYEQELTLKEQEVYYDYLELCYKTTDVAKAKELVKKLTPCKK